MTGFTDVIVEGAGITEIGRPLGILAAFVVGFTVVAALRFRVEDSKLSWA